MHTSSKNDEEKKTLLEVWTEGYTKKIRWANISLLFFHFAIAVLLIGMSFHQQPFSSLEIVCSFCSLFVFFSASKVTFKVFIDTIQVNLEWQWHDQKFTESVLVYFFQSLFWG